MADLYLLGVDIGTQGVKCSLFDENGISHGSAFVPSNLTIRFIHANASK